MNIKPIVALAMLAVATLTCHAAENTVRLGIANITVHSQSSGLTSVPAITTPQPSGVTVGDATTALIGYTREIAPNWDLDLVVGWPPTHSVYGTGKLASFGETARITQAGPTLFVNYKFGAAEKVFRPFVGLGVNYTHFYNSRSTAAGDRATGGPTSIALTNSFGLAGQAGVVYRFNPSWFLNAAVAAAKVSTALTATTGSIDRKTNVDFRPVICTVAVGYAF